MAREDLAFEHRVLKPLKALKNPPRRWLLAVSGGADSMALAEFTRRWRRGLGLEKLIVAHVHHGLKGPMKQVRFRTQAQARLRDWCNSHAIEFITNTPEKIALVSEKELRDYRHKALEEWRASLDLDVVVFAHHADDLLETRLMRLIRGTGGFGLRAMRLYGARKLRPFLSVSRLEIENYLRSCGLEWSEDPSNFQHEAFRNWLRHEWLSSLEKRQPGAVKSLSRSLELISRTQRLKTRVDIDLNAGVRREVINNASSLEREELITVYLRGLGLNNYGQSHVREILKRVDTRKKNLTFEVLGVVFEVTPDFLRASRV